MPSEPLILFPPFRLDVGNEQLWRDNELLTVRPKPFAVLAYLATHPDRLVTAAELRKAVWPNTYVGEGLLRGYIREVRLVLGDDPEAPRFIETIPRRGYRFLPAVTTPPVSSCELRVASSPPASLATDHWQLTPRLVGRDSELTQLHRWLEKAARGTRQVVFVLGEPGIGKTTLVDAFLLEARDWRLETRSPSSSQASSSLIARGQCIEHYGVGEAYLPVLEALGQLCRQPGGEQVIALLSRYAPTWLAQMPALMSDTELEAIQRKVQGATRERMLRELAEAVEVLAATTPLVLVLEDLQWSDYSTLDLLSSLAQRRGPARLLLLGTYRPADVIMSGHPLKALKQELQVHGQCEELPVGFLTTAEVSRYLAARFPQQQFPHELGGVLHQSTEGNPLFMINVVDYWVSHGVLSETEGQWQLAAKVEELAAGVPESLRQMIEKQVERLTPEERRMIETASVVGGEFATAAVAAGLEEKEERIEEWCERLAAREHFVRARGAETVADGTVTGRYGFVHALYQQVLYEWLAAVRRVQLHRRIGDWAEGAYGKRVSEVAAELAMHFERGQDYERAVQYLTQAAENTLRRSAPREAIDLLTKGLKLLQMLPNTPERTQQELALRIALGVPLLMTKGYAAPEVEHTYARAREICQQLGANPQLLPALAGLFRFHLVRSELEIARGLGEQMLRLAQNSADPLLLAIAHSMLGVALTWLGEFPAAHDHLEQGQNLYDPQHHHFVALLYGDDPGVVCLSYGASALWYLGYPDQARKRIQEALALARELSIPHILAFALDSAAWLHLHCQEGHAAWEHVEALEALASNQGFQHWVAASTILRGRRLVQQRQEEEGAALMRQGLAAYRATGAELGRAQFLTLLVEAYGKIGRTEDGLTMLTEALATVNKTGERNYETELYRLKGELTLQRTNQKSKVKNQKSKIASPQPLTPSPQGVVQEAEGYFQKAIDIARKQHAKSLELRAVMSLVRLRQQQATRYGSRNTQPAARTQLDEAHSMLSEVYTWFTEGFDTKDLQEAKALLESLVCPAQKSRGGSIEAEARSRRGTPGR